MRLTSLIGLIILAIGAFLLGYGLSTTHSITEHVIEGVSGVQANNTPWIVVGGTALIVIGGLLTFLGSLNSKITK